MGSTSDKTERARQRALMTRYLDAAVKSDAEAVRRLLKEGLKLESRYNGTGRAPLHLCAQGGNMEVLGVLVEHGADPHSPDPFGCTTVLLAARWGSLEMLRFFLEAGVDPRIPDESGMTPLERAMLAHDEENDRRDHIRLLLLHGASPDQVGLRGVRTPRSLAADLRDRGGQDLTGLYPPPLPGREGVTVAGPPPSREIETLETLGVAVRTDHELESDATRFQDMFVGWEEDVLTSGRLIVQRLSAPLDLPSGRLIGADYIDIYDAPGFSESLPPGAYDVFLALAVNPDGPSSFPSDGPDLLVSAFLRIQFVDEPAVRWEPATLLGSSGWSSFGVDHGNAAFFDEEGQEALGQLSAEVDWPGLFGEATNVQGGQLAHVAMADGSAVMCTSGEGDGNYMCYFGRTENGDICAFVADFQIYEWSETEGQYEEEDDEDE